MDGTRDTQINIAHAYWNQTCIRNRSLAAAVWEQQVHFENLLLHFLSIFSFCNQLKYFHPQYGAERVGEIAAAGIMKNSQK